jgi:branched-chain amino acid transport system substrate-binding protein
MENWERENMLKKLTAPLIVSVAVALVVTGLSASVAVASSYAHATRSAHTAKGTRIDLGEIVTIQSSVYSFKDANQGAEAAVAAINKQGGVNGHLLKLNVCDDQLDPNRAESCATAAARSADVALTGDFTFYGAEVDPVLDHAGLADVGLQAISTTDYTAKSSFLLDGGLFSAFGGMPIYLKKQDHLTKLVSIMSDSTAVQSNEYFIGKGAASVGATIVKTVVVPSGTVDFTPYVAELQSSGATGVVNALSASDLPRFLQAAKEQGLTLPEVAAAGNTTPDVLQAAGSAADGLKVVDSLPTPSSSAGYAQQYRKQLKAYAPGAQPDNKGMRAWASVYLVAQVAKQIHGKVTREAVLKGLRALHGESFDWIPDLYYNKRGPVAALPDLTNGGVFPYVVKNGVLVSSGAVIK